nr:hypothetical protein [Acanthopleuribacter pedis]
MGTDVHIGEPGSYEQRVAITPDQMAMLKNWLKELGVNSHFYVVAGAGNGAGFSDAQYGEAGGSIIEENQIPNMAHQPDLVHALKESTAYEATIPGSFIRIGALHSGDFRPNTGLAEFVARGSFSGIFDGSAVGGFAYKMDTKIRPKYPVPLRSSMSVYAGKLAGLDVSEHLDVDEKVVVSGGGIAGTSAVSVLLEEKNLSRIREILILEKFPRRCEALREEYAAYPKVRIKQAGLVEDEDLEGAKGFILTIFLQGSGDTPKVADVSQLRLMRENSAIVDVAIDEGGGISIPKEEIVDPETGRRPLITADDVREAISKLGKNLAYTADNHMPRRQPKLASVEHGETALMYLATLLYLAAREGGAEAAMKHIMDQDYIENPKDILHALVLDLKHGLAFSRQEDVMVLYRHVLKKSDNIAGFLREQGVTPVFS